VHLIEITAASRYVVPPICLKGSPGKKPTSAAKAGNVARGGASPSRNTDAYLFRDTDAVEWRGHIR